MEERGLHSGRRGGAVEGQAGGAAGKRVPPRAAGGGCSCKVASVRPQSCILPPGCRVGRIQIFQGTPGGEVRLRPVFTLLDLR